jgi:ABC-2 type transport system permease protein
MPTWLQKESHLLPVTHFVIIARGVMLKGVGLETLWRNGLFLLGFASALMALATIRFKKKLG